MNTTTKKLFMAVTLIAVAATTVQARSWRINNDVTKAPDFTSINAAMSSEDVVAGDTLYMDPGCGLTSAQTISKQVVVIGCGYFRAEAPHAMASIVAVITINAPYTKIEGVIFNAQVRVTASNVTIERCKAQEIYVGYNNVTAQNVTIRQCYATRVRGNDKTSLQSAYCTIENCIIMHNGDYGVIDELYFPTIKNCYLREAQSSSNLYQSNVFSNLSHYTVHDNIIINVNRPTQIWYGCSDAELVQNNVISSSDGVTETSVFALEGADDRRYQLKEDSPAHGAATDGGDCGPSGGLYPYVPGGMPAGHPYYTKAVISPRSENDKVKVSLQIKMQNE
jgi:hypothetical protein